MTYQPDTLTEARFNGTSNSHLLTLVNQANYNALDAIRSFNEFRAEVDTKFSLLTEAEALATITSSITKDAAGAINGFKINGEQPFTVKAGNVQIADVTLASVYASKAEVEALRQEVAHLKSVQQDNFNMAVRAVAEVLVAADKAGTEQDAETMGEKMLAMIRSGGAE